MGLKSDIMLAKREALKAQDIEIDEADFQEGSPNEIEARYMTNAFVDFLTHDDLHFTISKLKASVEIEEFHTFEALDADVKSEKVVKDKISEISSAKTGTDLIVGKLEQLKDISIPLPAGEIKPLSSILGPFITMYKTFWKTIEKTVTKSIPKSEGEGDIRVNPQSYLIEGGKNGPVDARGHAHIGIEDPVKNSDTMDPESDDNQVDLYRDKIPDEILD
jgi:phage FluMu protein gp41